MAETRDGLLKHYQQTRQQLVAAIHGLSDQQLLDTSLDGWSVKDHLAHVAHWDEIRATEVLRISAGHESAWRMTQEQHETYIALVHDLQADLTLDQVRWELELARQRLMSAISSATEHGLDARRYGEASLRTTHEVEHAGWIERWRSEKGF